MWDRILTTTPVIMTIISTLLAGLSSSEMTQAQYYRSLAAQNQSKAGDQWGFFQAKRIRGSGLENTADLLQTQISLADANELETAAHKVFLDLQRLDKSVQEALADPNNPKVRENPGLVAAIKKVQETTHDQLTKLTTEKWENALHQAFQRPEVRQIFDAFTHGRLPTVEDQAIDDPAMKQALKALGERKSDAEVDEIAGKLKYETLKQALEVAQKNARQADGETESLTKALAEVDRLLKELEALAGPWLKVLSQAQEASGLDGTNLERESFGARARAKLQGDIELLQKGFKAVQHQYNGLRNRREADYNQNLAFVYEVQVHKNGVDADRHRQRSKNFFYGMLVAQAGMAISSFSLAARKKSVLWLLACLAGLTAVAFSGYVYLSM
jgi:hypothetical protein